MKIASISAATVSGRFVVRTTDEELGATDIVDPTITHECSVLPMFASLKGGAGRLRGKFVLVRPGATQFAPKSAQDLFRPRTRAKLDGQARS
jgi:hypothetical protein